MHPRDYVYRDVAYALREQIIDDTLFSRKSYHSEVVPNAEPMKGFKADKEAWALILTYVIIRLHQMDNEYRHIVPSEELTTGSLNKNVTQIASLLTDEIIKAGSKANKPIA